MERKVTIIFPHQLFKENPAIEKGRKIYLIEEWLYFKQYAFHKQKLILHRASMKFYEEWLKGNGFEVEYIQSTDPENDCRELIFKLSKLGLKELYMSDPVDDWLLKRVKSASRKFYINLHISEYPGFFNSFQTINSFFEGKKKYFQTDFYIWQRKEKDILLDSEMNPIGGKWTYDVENRKKMPAKENVPVIKKIHVNKYLSEAVDYVNQHFPNNPGSSDSPHLFVVTFDDAEIWMKDFLQFRFEKFGIYEDAIVEKQHVLFHSVISPMLNIGLLQPKQVLEMAIKFADESNIPLNSLEGFVRQILGWREFMRFMYEKEGQKQRTYNFWKFKRRLPKSFWTGETGIVPIDQTIRKIIKTGYCHHIERLMVLGNFMLLCEFDPDDVYQWFMEMFIDAYDWVMVPNVYGMSQFADGGIMTTKPYISGSNYLMKMSDFEKGEWQTTWDALFWRFMHVHRNFFVRNPRLGMLVGTFDKMADEKQKQHLKIAEKFLETLDNKME